MNASEQLAEILSHRRLWIFDLDGTLADTSPVHAQAFAEVLAPHGVDVAYDRVAGMKTDDAIELLFGEQGVALTPDLRDRLCDEKRLRARALIAAGLPPLEGVQAVLDHARHKALALALCSSGSRGTVKATLAAIGLADRFEPVITADDVRRAKPNPEGFLAVLDYHRATPNDAVVFEDSAAGLASADAAGLTTIQIVPTGPVDRIDGRWTASWPALRDAIGATTL